jgi:phosphoribosylanthranilate isomerase
MFRIKICGITRPEDALAAVTAGADAIGLNFYPQSARFVGDEQARRIAAAVPAGVARVGVFVNASADEIKRTFDRTPLDIIQLHGDEPPELLCQFGDRPIMRVFRVGSAGLAAALEYLNRCCQLGIVPRLVLADAPAGPAYGGTGQLADWSALAGYPSTAWHPPLILAGGLTPENVAAAIRTVRPSGRRHSQRGRGQPGSQRSRAVEAVRAGSSKRDGSGGGCPPAYSPRGRNV